MGQFWTPIPAIGGSVLHADQQAGLHIVDIASEKTALILCEACRKARRSDIDASVPIYMINTPTALERLLGLGLADDWGILDGLPYAAANPLARPLAGDLDEPTRARLAAAALPGLGAAWRQPDGTFAWDWRAVEITRLALIAPALLPAQVLRGHVQVSIHDREIPVVLIGPRLDPADH